MTDYVYFDGDPATDSARRHMERVLKESNTRRRWLWVGVPLAGLAAWYFWPRKPAARDEQATNESAGAQAAPDERSARTTRLPDRAPNQSTISE
jgi:hypothetical protein